MGDGADMALDSIDWAEEWGYWDEYDSFFFTPRNKTCNRCGEERLFWCQDKKGRWLLKNTQGHWHVCWKKELKNFEVRYAINGEEISR
jgi:hypothetical protein